VADSHLTGITLKLTVEQKRLLRQISDEDFSEIVVGIGTTADTVPNEYGAGEDNLRFLNVLYETNVDLAQRVDENPTVKESLKELAEVGGYIIQPQLISGPPLGLAPGTVGPLTFQPGSFQTVSFQGLLATAAAW
jgi:hypothetical protein